MGKLKWKCVNNLKKSIFYKLYMSGSAALSAAKNRRTGSAPPNPPGSSKMSQQPITEQQIPAPKNPLQILYLHELRLNELEKFNAENETQGNDKQGNDKRVINKIDNEVVIKTLTDKISQLEQQCYMLKNELTKIMSFAMETNRAFLLYKNDKETQEKKEKQEKLEQRVLEQQIQIQEQ
jgi:hypothetical protein